MLLLGMNPQSLGPLLSACCVIISTCIMSNFLDCLPLTGSWSICQWDNFSTCHVLLTVTVHWMGSPQQMVQEAATVAHQKVLWWEDRPLLCLAWLLYKNAYPSICCWSTLLLLWPPFHDIQWQYSKVQNTGYLQQGHKTVNCQASPDKAQYKKGVLNTDAFKIELVTEMI